jgi:hypothetical protein
MTGLPVSAVKNNENLKFKRSVIKNDDIISTNSNSAVSLQSFQSSISPAPKIKSETITDKNILTELDKITKELIQAHNTIMKQKQEIKKGLDLLKKQEKELLEIHKKHDSKEIALDKLRRERNNLYAAMNSDKYKDFTTVEEIEYKF